MTQAVTYEMAAKCAAELKHVCARLTPYFDFASVSAHLSAESVLGAALVGAPPSPCAPRVTAMFEGGLSGLRSYLHLASEAIFLNKAGFDPTSEKTPLEPTVLKEGLNADEVILARHVALFKFEAEQGTGLTLWAKAHCESLGSELGMVEYLLEQQSKLKAAKGQSFWFDPGLSQQQIDQNADIAQQLGLVVAPRSVASPDAYRAAYAALAKVAG